MKKIINGKIYNTDTAKAVGGYASNSTTSDLDYFEETLYIKKTGEFFLYGEGSAISKYGTRCGDSWGYGYSIIPLSWEEAREWSEKRLSVDNYEKIFGEVEEDESKRMITLSLSAGAVERAKRAAQQAGMSLSAYIESLIG